MRSTIFMIHGMWAGSWVWDRFIPFFSERGYRCVAPTLRHHDALPEQPPAQLGRVSLLDYAADLAGRYAPCSTYKEFAGSGHWLIGAPGWSCIAEYVAGWLGQLEPSVPALGAPSGAPAS